MASHSTDPRERLDVRTDKPPAEAARGDNNPGKMYVLDLGGISAGRKF